MSIIDLITNELWDLFLLECKHPDLFNVNIMDQNGNTPLHLLVHKNKLDLIRKILYSKPNFNARNKNGSLCLDIAIYNNNLKIAKLLLENGYDVNLRDKQGNDALHNAVLCSNLEIVELILRYGPKLQKNNIGNNAIQSCILYGNNKIMKALLNSKSLIKNKKVFSNINNKGENLLHLCASRNRLEMMRLLRNKIPINDKDYEGRTPLHVAVENDNWLVALYLLQIGGDINSQDIDGCTALHMAAKLKSDKIFNMLLEQKADMQLKNHNGDTVLHCAASAGYLNRVRIVMSSIDVNEENHSRHTALSLAKELGHYVLVEYLTDYCSNRKTFHS